MEGKVGAAFLIISNAYHGMVAERSQVPLINHIKEGLTILDRINASEDSKIAFCLHPLIQDDENFINNIDSVVYLDTVSSKVLVYLMEYRNIANRSLSDIVEYDPESEDCHLTRSIRVSPLNGVNAMLIADKVQNRKDFELYHKGTHEHSKELAFYFTVWLHMLGIDETKYQQLIEGL